MSVVTESIKRTVRVTIEKEYEIELTPAMFLGMSLEDYLAEFRKGLFHVDSIDDVVKYAARMAAYYDGGSTHDGLGLLAAHNSTYPRVPDVKFLELMDECEEEILSVSEGVKS